MRSGCADRLLTPESLRQFAAFCAISVCLLGTGCGGTHAIPATPADLQQLKAEAAAAPRLQAGDKIGVTVYGENSLSGQYQIDPTGFVSLPLAGTIKAAGLTQHLLEQEIANHLSSGFLKNPRVTVSISEFRQFYILGEVGHPGAFPYTSGLNVKSAIATAGGTTYRANESTILIQHAGQSEMRAYDASEPIPILPGDIIEIPRRYF
jgi:polysaccharide export outer membrane protein